jgi:hypothetical protein
MQPIQSIPSQQPAQSQQMPDDMNPNAIENEQSGGGFTIDADLIEEHVKQQMDKNDQNKLDRLLEEGNELLFGKETHYKMLEGIENSQNISKDLGEGAYSMMMLLIKQGANIPGEIIPPAGAILIARVADFLNQSGLNKVSDEDFSNAVETFGHLIMQHDPQFMERMKQNTGGQDAAAMQQDQQAPPMPQQGGGGLLNMTGRS